MQEKWAALLANAINSTTDANPIFIDILKQLTQQEACLLDKLYSEAANKTYEERNSLQFSKANVMKLFQLTDEKIDIILDDLIRLNLCRMPASHNGAKIGNYPIMIQTKDFFEITSLGFAFVKMCQPNI